MQKTRLFGHEQNFVWCGKTVDSICTGMFTEPCTEYISSIGSKGLDERYTKTSVTIFAGGVN